MTTVTNALPNPASTNARQSESSDANVVDGTDPASAAFLGVLSSASAVLPVRIGVADGLERNTTSESAARARASLGDAARESPVRASDVTAADAARRDLRTPSQRAALSEAGGRGAADATNSGRASADPGLQRAGEGAGADQPVRSAAETSADGAARGSAEHARVGAGESTRAGTPTGTPPPVHAHAAAVSSRVASPVQAGSPVGAVAGAKVGGVESAAAANTRATPSAIASPSPLTLRTSAAPSTAQTAKPNAPSAPPAPPTPQIVRGLASLLRSNGGSLSLELNPRALGAVQIKLDMADGEVAATIRTSTESARRLLSDARAELQSALEARGLVVRRLAVEPMAAGIEADTRDDPADRAPRDPADRDPERSPGREDAPARERDPRGDHAGSTPGRAPPGPDAHSAEDPRDLESAESGRGASGLEDRHADRWIGVDLVA